MPGENLTRAEAEERAALIHVEDYAIDLDLTVDAEVFLSTSTVRFTAEPGASTFIDAITRDVVSVTLNGDALDVATVSDGVRIHLPGLQESNELTVVSHARYTNTGEGLHRFVDPVDGEVYLYSQFEVPDSRRVFAVFEQPDLKASFTFTVRAPEEWVVVSNSPVHRIDEPRAGAKTWRFEPTARISSYITAVVAGPYVGRHSALTSSDGRNIPLGIYVRKSLVEYLDADEIFDITRRGFAFYEKEFGRAYPFEKYDQLFVPEYNAGAMENAGAITFTEKYIFRAKVSDAIRERRVVTILHELAHMWFGDLVTMRWWNDLWLNESFAEYMSALASAEATRWTQAWTTFASMEKSWAYRQDQLPSTHPIVAEIRDLEDVQVNFDGITYAKGASVLKQLVAWVGREKFFAGLRRYFEKHAFGNTRLADLLGELEAISGRDLAEWSRLWLESAGVNTLRPEITSEGSTITSFTILQSAPEEHPVLRPHRLAVGIYELENGRLVRRQRVELDVAGERTEVPALVGLDRGDLILINDEDLTYAKIRLDEHSRATALAHLSDIDDPLARTLIWGSIWDATRDAELPARQYIDAVLVSIASETESTPLRTTLGQLTLAAERYVSPEHRSEYVSKVADRLWSLAKAAAPGSDAQFQFVTSFAALAQTPAQLDTVAALRHGTTTLTGLTIDTDLDWALLTALVAGGRAGVAEVEAAHRADDTANGAQLARQAAAAGGLEAKRAAWSTVFEQDTLPNAQVRFTGLGFQRSADPQVFAEFMPRYFDALQTVWASRTYKIAEYLVDGFYPAALANDALVQATRAWLAGNPEPAALNRLVTENLARTERAVAAQERDRRG